MFHIYNVSLSILVTGEVQVTFWRLNEEADEDRENTYIVKNVKRLMGALALWEADLIGDESRYDKTGIHMNLYSMKRDGIA